MGELINLRRRKKTAARAEKEKTTIANRVMHGTPKHLRKKAKADQELAVQKIEAHRLEPKEPRSKEKSSS